MPAQQFKTWILPLRAEELAGDDGAGLRLVAPSNFHRQWLRDRYLRRIEELGEEFFGGLPTIEVSLAPAGGLRRAGVGRFEDLGLCTYADEARFFSHRRMVHRGEADYGRLLHASWQEPAGPVRALLRSTRRDGWRRRR